MPPLKITARLQMVSERIQKKELKHLSRNERWRHQEGNWATICPENGKRFSVYRSSPPDRLYDELDQFLKVTELDISGIKAADLGSGLGASSIAISYFCKSVTGFELSAGFIKDAGTITREFGYGRIKFRHADFIEADLSKFKLWYVFQPFFVGFADIMASKIGEAAPGTLIILRSCLYPQLQGIPGTESLYPADRTDRKNGDFKVLRKL